MVYFFSVYFFIKRFYIYLTSNIINMAENNEENRKISDYITYPRTFENYRWYKPILVFIVVLIMYVIFLIIIDVVFGNIFGSKLVDSLMEGGYEVLNNPLGELLSDLTLVIMIPSLYIATKIVKDRPFSSYSSSRGGWNSKLYFKALIIPFIMTIAFMLLGIVIDGADPNAVNHFSVEYLILSLIFIPLQCISEEYIFRGFFMQTFGSWFKIPVLAIILQSIVFTVGHGYNLVGLIEIFISGCIFGFLAWKTSGIEVTSALHTANNLTISLLVQFGLIVTSSTVGITDVLISTVFDILLCGVIYYIGIKTDWYGEIKEVQ